jgi:hypothetical protein
MILHSETLMVTNLDRTYKIKNIIPWYARVLNGGEYAPCSYSHAYANVYISIIKSICKFLTSSQNIYRENGVNMNLHS